MMTLLECNAVGKTNKPQEYGESKTQIVEIQLWISLERKIIIKPRDRKKYCFYLGNKL